MIDLSTIRAHYRFLHGGRMRELRDPDGPPSPRQLHWLARRDLLRLIGAPDLLLTKAICAAAIDRMIENDETADEAEGREP